MVRRLRIFIMSNWGLMLILLLSLVLHLAMVWQGGQHNVWESPDANINWHFAQLVAQGQKPAFTADSSELKEYLTPRSAIVVGNAIVPAGFLGLIYLYGMLAGLFGLSSLVWWTAIISTIAVLYFYLLIKSVFGQQTAWWSAALLTIHPAWWYYTDRSLLPTILFVSFLIIAMYYWHEMSRRGKAWHFILATFFTSMCLVVRPSEVIWVATSTIVYLILQRRRLFWSSLIWLLLGLIPLVLLITSHSLDLHQLILGSGYSVAQKIGNNGLSNIWQVILPFGFHPRLIIYVAWNFLLVLMWPFTLFTGLGYLLARRHFVEHRHGYYFFGWAALSLYLIMYYGSWPLTDNPNPAAVTIGISYVRYLLPVYVFGLPYLAWFLLTFGREFLPRMRRLWLGLMFGALMLFTLQTAILHGEESWWSQRQDLYAYDQIAGRVTAEVPAEAIILTERADKYLWPAHTVLVPQGDDHYLQAAEELLEQGRMIYYVRPSLSAIQLDYLQTSWKQYNLHLGPMLFDQEGVAVYPVSILAKDAN
jgi:hypothetical protein